MEKRILGLTEALLTLQLTSARSVMKHSYFQGPSKRREESSQIVASSTQLDL